MSTAVEKSEAAPAKTDSPVAFADLASALYGSESDAKADPPASDEKTPEPKTDADHSPQAGDKPAETPNPDDAKPEQKDDASKGTEGIEQVKEQLSHQTAANRRLGREIADLKKTVNQLIQERDELKAKVDGTWKEPAKPTPEQIEAQAEWRGRERASRVEANKLYGEEKVTEQIYGDEGDPDPQTPFIKLITAKPWIQVEVVKHPQPAVHAMRVLEREAFFEKYGEDPAQWVHKIVEEHKPKILEEFKKQATAPVVGKPVPSVSDGRGAGQGSREPRSLADRIYGTKG